MRRISCTPLLLVAAVATSLVSSAFAALIVAHKNSTNPYNFRNPDCQAKLLEGIYHPYVENSLEGIAHAYDAGADVAEFDLRLTRDKEIVIFHDESLDCLTDGKGLVRDWDLRDLRKLNMAWGLSADGGRTFPWRARPVRMSTLAELLRRFPHQRLMFNPKDRGPEMAQAMLKVMRKFHRKWEQDFYWGDPGVYNLVKGGMHQFPDHLPNQWHMETCLEAYKTVGWLGLFPQVCKKKWLVIDAKNEDWNFWGWPSRFIEEAHRQGSKVWVFSVEGRGRSHYYALHADVVMSTYVWRLFK